MKTISWEDYTRKVKRMAVPNNTGSVFDIKEARNKRNNRLTKKEAEKVLKEKRKW